MVVVSSESSPLVASTTTVTAKENDEWSLQIGSSSSSTAPSGRWKIGVFGFVLGVAVATSIHAFTGRLLSSSWNNGNNDDEAATATVAFPLLTSTVWQHKTVEEDHHHHPALHYFAKASTEFTATLPLMKDRDNSFLADLVTR
jgi:hypothetical protein